MHGRSPHAISARRKADRRVHRRAYRTYRAGSHSEIALSWRAPLRVSIFARTGLAERGILADAAVG